MARTSISDPLRIDELACGGGAVGLTFCPVSAGMPFSANAGIEILTPTSR